MANDCFNGIVFYGKDSVVLQKLRCQIERCISSSARNSFPYLFKLNGYTEEEIKKICDRRDQFYSCDPEISCDGSTYYFQVDTVTAWTPHMEVFETLLQRTYRNRIQFVYIAEESGCGVYENSDRNGTYFKIRYKVSCCHKGIYYDKYFEDYGTMLEWVQNEYDGVDMSDSRTTLDIEEKIADLDTLDDEDYFYIGNFTDPYEERRAS